MHRFGLCLDPKSAAASGIVEKTLRALDPSQAKSAKDARHRLALRRKLIGQTMRGPAIRQESVLPGFRDRSLGEEVLAVPIASRDLRQLAEKITRGIVYLEDGSSIDPPYGVSFYMMHDESAGPVWKILQQHAKVYAREPGIVVRRAVAEDDKMTALLDIEIWGQLRMYTFIDDDPN